MPPHRLNCFLSAHSSPDRGFKMWDMADFLPDPTKVPQSVGWIWLLSISACRNSSRQVVNDHNTECLIRGRGGAIFHLALPFSCWKIRLSGFFAHIYNEGICLCLCFYPFSLFPVLLCITYPMIDASFFIFLFFCIPMPFFCILHGPGSPYRPYRHSAFSH